MNPEEETVASTLHVRRGGLWLAACALIAIAIITLVPSDDPGVNSHLCVVCGSRGGVDAILNVLLFIPLGFGLGLASWRARSTLAATLLLSIVIETLQLSVVPGRDASVGDVITNTLGGMIGFVLATHGNRLLQATTKRARVLLAIYCVLWILIQTGTSAAFSLAFPGSQYYGQLGRRLGRFEQFRGLVTDARVGSMAIPDTRVGDSKSMRNALDSGADVSVSLVAAAPSHGLAPIVRVADANQQEILLVGQRGEDLVFSVRTVAAVMRLRPPFFLLRSAFQSFGGPTLVRARYHRGYAELASAAGEQATQAHVAVRPTLGWTLILPMQWWLSGSTIEALFSAVWAAILVLPAAYWGFLGIGERGTLRGGGGQALPALLIAASIGATVVIGYVVVPAGFGVAPATIIDFASVAVALALGAIAAIQMKPRNQIVDS